MGFTYEKLYRLPTVGPLTDIRSQVSQYHWQYKSKGPICKQDKVKIFDQKETDNMELFTSFMFLFYLLTKTEAYCPFGSMEETSIPNNL